MTMVMLHFQSSVLYSQKLTSTRLISIPNANPKSKFNSHLFLFLDSLGQCNSIDWSHVYVNLTNVIPIQY